MSYFVIVGDIVGSREMKNRAGVQRQLQTAIGELNRRVPSSVAPLRLTAGDETQGISHCEHPDYLLDVVTHLSDAISPARIAWGAGHGGLSTDLQSDVAMLDGECFHRAREALEETRREGTSFSVRGIDQPFAQVLTALMNLVGSLRSDWTTRQSEYVRARREMSQADIAEAFGVNPSTVSRALAAARFSRVDEGEAAARTLLNSLRSEPC